MRRAVLFDMDGVISDTERFYVEAMIDGRGTVNGM